MPRRIISLDFRDDALVAVVLRQTLREVLVEDWAVEPLDGDGSELHRWEAALAAVLQRVSTDDAVCTAGFPSHWLSYRSLRAPFSNAKKIRQILGYELEPLLPQTADETVADFVLGAAAGGEQGRQVVAAAASRERVSHFLELLAEAGLKPRTAPVGSHCLGLSLMETGEVPGQWLSLDLDRRRCNFCVVDAGRVEQLGSLPLGLDGSEAVEALVAAVNRSMAAMEARSTAAPAPELVYVTGRGASQEALLERMRSAFEVEVEPVRLERRFSKLQFVSVPDREHADTLQVALAMALSELLRLEGIQLKQGAFAESGLLSRHKGSLIRSGALILLALAVYATGFGIDLVRKQHQQQRLQAQIEQVFRSTFPEVRRVVDPVAQMQINLREARESIQRAGIQENTLHTLDVMAEISRRVPLQLDVILTRLDISTDSVLMAGDTGNFNTVDEIKRRLEQSPLFREVNINSTAKSKSGERVEFKMTIDI